MATLNPALHRCRASSPHRPPSWRWDRAGVLLHYGRRTPGLKDDDEWVRKAYRLRKALETCPGDVEAYRILQSAGDLGEAYYLWDEYTLAPTRSLPIPGTGGRTSANPQLTGPALSQLNNPVASLSRHELEARLLCGQDIGEIAFRLGVSDEVIETYEKVFYNVHDRLAHVSWVLHHVIGPLIHQGMTDRDLPVLWKLYGYTFQSAAFLDQIISTIWGNMRSDVSDAKDRLIEDYGWNVVLKAAKAARALPVDDRTRARILELQAAIKTADKEGDLDATSGGSYQAHLTAALNQVNWTVGGQITFRVGASGEPRANEMLVAAAHRQAGSSEPVIVDSDGSSFKYPEKATELPK